MTSPDKCGITHTANLGILGKKSLSIIEIKVPSPEPVPPAIL